METKVTGSGRMASNRERGHGSSRTVAPAEEQEERCNIISRLSRGVFIMKQICNFFTHVTLTTRGRKRTFFRVLTLPHFLHKALSSISGVGEVTAVTMRDQ